MLDALAAQLGRFHSALTSCPAESFLRVGACYPEMSVHEKSSIDFYIELLKRMQLDENVPLEAAEKGQHYFQQIFGLHLEEGEKINCPQFLRDHVRAIASAVDALVPEVRLVK